MAGEHLSQTGNKAFLLSQGNRSAQVCLGGSGEGDGLLGRPPPAPLAVLCISCWQAGARPVSLGARVGPEGSGIWVRLIGPPLRHRGPSPSWGDWAVILEGPSRRGSQSTWARCGIQEGVVPLHPQAGGTQ